MIEHTSLLEFSLEGIDLYTKTAKSKTLKAAILFWYFLLLEFGV